MQIILDGGVQRGTDIAKALALGAGRPSAPASPARSHNMLFRRLVLLLSAIVVVCGYPTLPPILEFSAAKPPPFRNWKEILIEEPRFLDFVANHKLEPCH